MIHDYLKAGYPALCVLTQEPHRAEHSLPCNGWRFVIWDCLQGIRDVPCEGRSKSEAGGGVKL